MEPEVRRGDLVVFLLPRDTAHSWVKRVIGLPADRVQYRAGRLFLNGAEVRRESLGEAFIRAPGRTRVRAARFEEALPDGRTYEIFELGNDQPFDNTPEYRVPPNHVFLLGDHRDESLDSRAMNAIGYVPASNLVAIVTDIISPSR